MFALYIIKRYPSFINIEYQDMTIKSPTRHTFIESKAAIVTKMIYAVNSPPPMNTKYPKPTADIKMGMLHPKNIYKATFYPIFWLYSLSFFFR